MSGLVVNPFVSFPAGELPWAQQAVNSVKSADTLDVELTGRIKPGNYLILVLSYPDSNTVTSVTEVGGNLFTKLVECSKNGVHIDVWTTTAHGDDYTAQILMNTPSPICANLTEWNTINSDEPGINGSNQDNNGLIECAMVETSSPNTVVLAGAVYAGSGVVADGPFNEFSEMQDVGCDDGHDPLNQLLAFRLVGLDRASTSWQLNTDANWCSVIAAFFLA